MGDVTFRRWASAVAVVLPVVVGACGAPGHPETAARLRDLRLDGPARIVGSLDVAAEGDLVSARTAGRQAAVQLVSVGVTVDLNTVRSALTLGEEVVAILGAEGAYVRRRSASPADRRQWTRLDFERLPEGPTPARATLVEGLTSGDVVALDPLLLVDLLAGVLAGSVRVSDDAEGGARRITGNVSLAKAHRTLDVSEETDRTRRQLLRSLAVTGDVHPAEIVLAADGALERLTVRFAVEPDRQTDATLVAALAVQRDAAGADLTALPPPETSVRVRELGGLEIELIRWLSSGGTTPNADPVAGATP